MRPLDQLSKRRVTTLSTAQHDVDGKLRIAVHHHEKARHRVTRIQRDEVARQPQAVEQGGELSAAACDAAPAQEVRAFGQHRAVVMVLQEEQRTRAAFPRVAAGAPVELDVQPWQASGRWRRQGWLACGSQSRWELLWWSATRAGRNPCNGRAGARGEVCRGARGSRLPGDAAKLIAHC
jgi:hypothetical protein